MKRDTQSRSCEMATGLELWAGAIASTLLDHFMSPPARQSSGFAVSFDYICSHNEGLLLLHEFIMLRMRNSFISTIFRCYNRIIDKIRFVLKYSWKLKFEYIVLFLVACTCNIVYDMDLCTFIQDASISKLC